MPANSNSQKGNLLIIVLLLVSFLSIGLIVFYLYFKNNSNKPSKTNLSNSTPTVSNSIDTSNWQSFPEKGSYTGWTIMHPVENKPLGVQAEYRISIDSPELESIRISIQNGKYADGTLNKSINMYKDSDYCTSKSDITSIIMNTYEAYKFTSICETQNKVTYIIVNPYVKNNYISIKVLTETVATQYQKDLSQKIISTLTFVKPEETTEEGFDTFYNVDLGFSLKYPENFRQETDNAWDNANLILYSGGQSYDLIVQIWNNESEYKKFYGDNSMMLNNITAHKLGGKIVTLLNTNDTEEVSEIIKTFKVTND